MIVLFYGQILKSLIQELKKSALIIIGADLMHLVTSTARFISSGNSI